MARDGPGGGMMPGDDDAPLLDQERLDMLRALDDGAGEMLGQIVDMWIEEVPPRLEQLRRAVDAGDAEEACMTAHGVKGSSYNMGANVAGDIAHDIEQRSRKGDLEGAPELVTSLEDAFARSRDALLRDLGR